MITDYETAIVENVESTKILKTLKVSLIIYNYKSILLKLFWYISCNFLNAFYLYLKNFATYINFILVFFLRFYYKQFLYQ